VRLIILEHNGTGGYGGGANGVTGPAGVGANGTTNTEVVGAV
jgi:hypothetical protein